MVEVERRISGFFIAREKRTWKGGGGGSGEAGVLESVGKDNTERRRHGSFGTSQETPNHA